MSPLGPRPKNADFPLLKVERLCCDAGEGARLKGKLKSASSALRTMPIIGPDQVSGTVPGHRRHRQTADGDDSSPSSSGQNRQL
jgi:hypothetical protein